MTKIEQLYHYAFKHGMPYWKFCDWLEDKDLKLSLKLLKASLLIECNPTVYLVNTAIPLYADLNKGDNLLP